MVTSGVEGVRHGCDGFRKGAKTDQRKPPYPLPVVPASAEHPLSARAETAAMDPKVSTVVRDRVIRVIAPLFDGAEVIRRVKGQC